MLNIRSLSAAAVIAMSMGILPAQTPNTKPSRSFEIASVKVHQGDAPGFRISTSGNHFRAEAESVIDLLMYAYHLKNYELYLPKQLDSFNEERYDLLANAPEGITPAPEEFRQMLQDLLKSSFKLTMHKEPRMIEAYELQAARGDARLKRNNSEGDCETAGGYVPGSRTYHQTFKHCGTGVIAQLLNSADLPGPVLDETDLKGNFDGVLMYQRGPLEVTDQPEGSAPSVFDAVRELGLRLQKRKLPMAVFVIDQLQHPPRNQ